MLESLEKDVEPHTGIDVAIQSSLHASQAMYPSRPIVYNDESWARVRRPQLHFVRDIFGNPFRPVSFFPICRTDTALAPTQQMYEARDFSAMPVLADLS